MIKNVFITVGTTKYDDLMKEINQESFFQTLKKLGCQNLTIQYGNSVLPENFPKDKYVLESGEKIDITSYKFKFDNSMENNFKKDLENSDLIISHAGSGTILDALELNKKIIVVPNETLMDNHQFELANAMNKKKVIVSSSISELNHTLNNFEKVNFIPFLKENNSTFVDLLDNLMGFED
ncbi:glycosyl transferase [Neocallimastix lanati (nom. inval.)]|uniref:UDP-N-acetylglucosamine transferase subunit ALG13 n=1 Tax=Neocallimastix californiae TaxID=1754190 RepID=A0A1Y1ZYR9_9FUNG|nr:glycosyl transferase [Neocallimastix sp. JGI-2020a]ORY15358.1 glycosyl transferase [Neocallimastix californiae]|eukprot:ORY15358.1 glycosyl transferase [Neocallimastix californiae]